MNVFEATLLCEGIDTPVSEEQLREAWQVLIDTETAWHLQGWFGRTANSLIERGVCTPPGSEA